MRHEQQHPSWRHASESMAALLLLAMPYTIIVQQGHQEQQCTVPNGFSLSL